MYLRPATMCIADYYFLLNVLHLSQKGCKSLLKYCFAHARMYLFLHSCHDLLFVREEIPTSLRLMLSSFRFVNSRLLASRLLRCLGTLLLHLNCLLRYMLRH
jgi:hypothetical protein